MKRLIFILIVLCVVGTVFAKLPPITEKMPELFNVEDVYDEVIKELQKELNKGRYFEKSIDELNQDYLRGFIAKKVIDELNQNYLGGLIVKKVIDEIRQQTESETERINQAKKDKKFVSIEETRPIRNREDYRNMLYELYDKWYDIWILGDRTDPGTAEETHRVMTDIAVKKVIDYKEILMFHYDYY